MCRAENREDSVDAIAHLQVQGKIISLPSLFIYF